MAESSNWLSVGKSFASTIAGSTTTALKIYDEDGAERGRASENDNRKKEKHKKKKSSKKEKKHKKEKKERKYKTALVVSSRKTNVYHSSSGFSSSESDSESDRPARKARRLLGESDIISGNMKLTYLPNGDVALLPRKESTNAAGVEWRLDRRADRDMLLYEGMHPSDLVRYELLASVPYISTYQEDKFTSYLPTRGTKRALTSTQQYRQAQQRPSGLVVSAAKQHKDYENASKSAQIFLHRQQLLSERYKEQRLHHKYRYFAPNVRALLQDPTVRRLSMRHSASSSQSDGRMLGVAVLLPLPFIDTSTLCELGLASNSINGGSGSRDRDQGSGTALGWATAAEQAQLSAHIQLRDSNQRLREQPRHLPTVLAALAAQDKIAVLQRLASGRGYSALNKSTLKFRNKVDVAMDKAVAEKKIFILEQAIRDNSNDKLHSRALTLLLVQELSKAHHLQRAQEVLVEAVLQSPLDVELRLQHWGQQLGTFTSSDHGTLTEGLRKMYADVAQTAENAAAAAELLHSSALGQGEGSQLQREFAHWGLQADLLGLRADLLQLHLLLEMRTGHTERAVATVQAMLDMLLSGCGDTEQYCQCWDAEWARLGENRSVLPPIYMVHALAEAQNSGNVGYSAWVRAGCPAEQNALSKAGATPAQTDSFHAVFSALEATVQGLSADGTAALSAWRPPLPPASPTPPPPPSLALSDPAGSEQEREGEGALNRIAADWFLQQVVGQAEHSSSPDVSEGEGDEESELQEAAQQALSRDSNLSEENSATAADAVEEDGMVYSRLHGYRIKVTEEASGHIYRKILSEIAPAKLRDQAEHGVDDPSLATGTSSADAASATIGISTAPDIRDPLYARYRGHCYASAVQWRPLRAVSAIDAEAVEQQPERVIFSDDIKPALFLCSLNSRSDMAVGRETALRQRLVLCALKALGVGFSTSEASHSLVQRVSAVLRGRLTSAQEPCPLTDLLCGPLLSSCSSSPSGSQTVSDSTTTGTDKTVLLATLLGSLSSWVCTVEAALLIKHAICSKHSQDSQLNFIIRLLSDILRSCRESKTPVFTLGFVNMLRSALVQLLTARYQCECGAGLQSDAALQHWRAQCRSVIEGSIGQHPAGPAVGALAVWAQYLGAELELDQTAEALKLADKVLRSLPVATVNEGHAALVLTALRLCQQTARTTTDPSSKQQQQTTAVSLLVQFAHSGTLVNDSSNISTSAGQTELGCFDPSLGVYEGELKPCKKAGKIDSKASVVKTSTQAVLNAVALYHARILELAQKLEEDVQATDRVSSTQRQMGCVRLLGLEEGVHSNCSGGGEPELCILVELMAWLQQLTCPSSAAQQLEAPGLDVFTAAISLLRCILLRNKTVPAESATAEAEVSSKRYSKHLLQFLPDSAQVGGRSRGSLPEQALLLGLALSSSAEVAALVVLERLYTAQLRFLLTVLQGAPRCARLDVVSEAAYRAHCDFPCNSWFLQVFTTVKATQPGGYLHLRAHFRASALQRCLWGGGLCPEECWLVVQLEVAQAHLAARACTPELAPLQCPTVAWSCSTAAAAQDACWKHLQCWPGDAVDRVRTALEYVLSLPSGSQLAGLWELYIFLEAVCGRRESAKKVFFRAVSHCGWCHSLYALVSGPWLAQCFLDAERASLSSLLEQRGVLGLRQAS